MSLRSRWLSSPLSGRDMVADHFRGPAGLMPRSFIMQARMLWQGVAQRQLLACLLMGVLALGLRAALLPWFPVPLPRIHDEFSYLLAADTYASGRLTNPPHPLWQHFESFHILLQPTYISKYPPMQGLVMALGQSIFHQPWIGVWLSAGVMCAVICWMLQGWISAGWALLGGLLSVTQVGVLSYWMNSYWGGAVAAIGGAMLLGSIPRIARRQFPHTVTLAIGLAILMNSRPYDALVLGATATPALLWLLRKNKVPLRDVVLRIAAPALAVLVVAGAAMAYQNYRVTGNPLELPYRAYDKQYAASSMFIWSNPRTDVVYRHEVMRKFWLEWQAGNFESARRDPVESFITNSAVLYVSLFGFVPYLAPLLIWPFALRRPEEKITSFILIAALASLVPLAGFAPHYMAATCCLIFLRLLQSLERLHTWKVAGKPVGLMCTVGVLILLASQFSSAVFNVVRGVPVPSTFAQARADVIQRLSSAPGRQLVVVRYAPDHDVHQEWVYNRADIDSSAVVWAREMGEAADQPLFEYFKDRQTWLLQPDKSPPLLIPYSRRNQLDPELSSEAFSSDGRSFR